MSAVSVFQWVDEDGVTHFSDAGPTKDNAAKTISHYVIDDNFPENPDPEEDYFSIVNQWKRTNDERAAKAKLEQEDRQSRNTVSQAAPLPVDYQQPPERYYSGYLPTPYLYNRGRFHRRAHFLQQQPRQQEPKVHPPGFVGNVSAGK